jgi:hypothetical protein
MIHDYLENTFEGIVTNQDPDTGHPLLPAELCRLPLEVSIATGDAIHNLHSALDHLAWALVESNGGTPTDQTEFPLLLERPRDGKRNPIPLESMAT